MKKKTRGGKLKRLKKVKGMVKESKSDGEGKRKQFRRIVKAMKQESKCEGELK